IHVQGGIAARVTNSDGSRYFQLAQVDGGPWIVRGRNEPALTCRTGTPLRVTQLPDRWYSVRFRVTQKSGLTRLRAKVWPVFGPQPPAWQVDCWTTLTTSADTGSFALQRGGSGSVYFDDVAVLPVTGTIEPIPPP
ncbi:MAG TPA: hypothetical protein VKF60_17325, partial [Myxococcota bacterium]|nr:hypothetical protein [Myxococcota bacterium]